jgi:hypothetical protein
VSLNEEPTSTPVEQAPGRFHYMRRLASTPQKKGAAGKV